MSRCCRKASLKRWLLYSAVTLLKYPELFTHEAWQHLAYIGELTPGTEKVDYCGQEEYTMLYILVVCDTAQTQHPQCCTGDRREHWWLMLMKHQMQMPTEGKASKCIAWQWSSDRLTKDTHDSHLKSSTGKSTWRKKEKKITFGFLMHTEIQIRKEF